MNKKVTVVRPSKILFIRRDNIGDLVCTTPAIHEARIRFPEARIGILVNSYNADAVANNPDIEEVYIYRKAKHTPETGRLRVWYGNMKVLLRIRRERYDVGIGCGSYSPRLERYTAMTGASSRVGYIGSGHRGRTLYNIPMTDHGEPMHEVERTFRLLEPLGISGPPGPMMVFPSKQEVEGTKGFLTAEGRRAERPLVSMHISSRRKENRWPASKFAELGNLLAGRLGADVMLLWSPGSETNVHHPGDDEKAAAVSAMMASAPLAFRTDRLGQLIAALSLSDLVVCSDGGAMHIAAALSKPIVALWGSTDLVRWSPWGTRHLIVRKGTDASSVTVEEAFEAAGRLL